MSLLFLLVRDRFIWVSFFICLYKENLSCLTDVTPVTNWRQKENYVIFDLVPSNKCFLINLVIALSLRSGPLYLSVVYSNIYTYILLLYSNFVVFNSNDDSYKDKRKMRSGCYDVNKIGTHGLHVGNAHATEILSYSYVLFVFKRYMSRQKVCANKAGHQDFHFES